MMLGTLSSKRGFKWILFLYFTFLTPSFSARLLSSIFLKEGNLMKKEAEERMNQFCNSGKLGCASAFTSMGGFHLGEG
ncbi:unnamed protein product [Linum trigynum]|uniref:Uncharacterized protein n=1 Tax=Linum trigynum TaxID=586398 RepID=A0AAV2D0X3_9ROSI